MRCYSQGPVRSPIANNSLVYTNSGTTSIEEEEDTAYLLHSVLLRRYSYIANGIPTPPVNVIEKAVDLHAVRVIGSSGYQKCISYLWRGWLVQDENDPSFFVDYNDKDNPNFLVHMDPDRMRTPRNQNIAQLLFSLVYLALFTIAINSVNASGVIDIAEGALYFFTLGYICDELLKVYKAGYQILGFWNAFNAILYAFLTASFIFRIVGLTFAENSDGRTHYSTLGYNILAFTAPLFWCRLLLYLDSFRFFGAMLVVLKVMMKESVIFFALLIVIIIGFLQAFIGLDLTDDNVADDVWFIIESMMRAILGSPEFDGFDGFGPPWGAILYYCFTFIVMVCLDSELCGNKSKLMNDTRLSFSTFSLPCTTLPTRISMRTRTMNIWHCSVKRRCSSFAHQMRTSILLRSI